MNEQYPGAVPVAGTSMAMPYKDRSTGLLIFGILTILLGCLAGLLILLMLVGQMVVPDESRVPFASLVPAIGEYVILGVALIWLGVGSILAKRWARALLVIFSWSWLVVGIITMLVMAFVLPKVLSNLPSTGSLHQTELPTGAIALVMIFAMMFYGFFLVVLPAIWTFFYSSRHVKATCEALHPARSWTDGCPLPVLGLCVWMAFSAMMLLVMTLSGELVMPFFGMFLTGIPGAIYCLVLAIFLGGCAWLSYRLQPLGWWMILMTMGVLMVSGFLTFAQHDIYEMYRLMDFPEAQIERIRQTGLISGNMMMWMPLVFVLPLLGYLVFIKRYFRAKR